MIPDFVEWPKIPRLSREIIVTEKIDGTNGVIYFDDAGQMFVGSRTQWLTNSDNHGFRAWAEANKDELTKLGPGRHYGEWWGSGIQRGYGLQKGEKRFSLFNVSRWADDSVRPACCGVVPVLYRGMFHTECIELELEKLRMHGSVAALGFMRPEGVVVFHPQGNVGFKKTIEKDEEWKGKQGKAA